MKKNVSGVRIIRLARPGFRVSRQIFGVGENENHGIVRDSRFQIPN